MNDVPSPPSPFLMVTRLTQGYILVIDGAEAIACSNGRSLVTTIRSLLTRIDLGETLPLRTIPSPAGEAELTARRARNGHATRSPAPPPLRANGQDASDLEDVVVEGNPEVAQQNLMMLCEAYADGRLTRDDWERGLSLHCPGIGKREAEMTLASMTGEPVAPPRTQVGSDPKDLEKLARRRARQQAGDVASPPPTTSTLVVAEEDEAGEVPASVGLFDGDDPEAVLELLDPLDPGTFEDDEDPFTPPDPATPERERS